MVARFFAKMRLKFQDHAFNTVIESIAPLSFHFL